MIFPKKTQNLQQKPQSFRRMDGVFACALKEKKPLAKKINLDLSDKISTFKADFFSDNFSGRKKIVAPCFSNKKRKQKKAENNFVGKVFHRLKKTFSLQPIFLKRAFSVLLIFLVVAVGFFQNFNNAQSATYTWTQLGWGGGQSANNASHPTNQTGWTQFSSKDSYVEAKNSFGNDYLALNSISESSTQTSNNGLEDIHNAGGFNAGSKNHARVRGAGTNARVALAYGGVADVSAGQSFMLAIKSDDTVWAWGENASGQLGDGTLNHRYTPVQILGDNGVDYLGDVEDVSAGANHSLALKYDGTVWAWGNNDNGQLGDNTIGLKNYPIQVKGEGGTGFLTDVTAISAGKNFSLALKSDGTVWAWGENDLGQLGDNSTSDSRTPIQVADLGGIGHLSSVSSISAGYNHSLALKADGSVLSWGENEKGQLGDNSNTDSLVPIQVVVSGGVGNLEDVTQISAGNSHSLVLKLDGSVWAWGENGSGQLGNDSVVDSKVPVQVMNYNGIGYLSGIVSIEAGYRFSLAIKNTGVAFSWGYNGTGQLGDNTIIDEYIPVKILDSTGLADLGNVSVISGGGSETIALQSDGTLWDWGNNDRGQLADNTVTNRKIAVQVWGPASGTLSDIVQADSGYGHTIALKSDGKVWSWGWNGSGQLGNNAGDFRLTPVPVMGTGGVGFLDHVQTVAAGQYHSLALKDDGTVWAWGYGDYGQLGDGTWASKYTPVQVKDSAGTGFLTNIIYISAGESYSMAVKDDGSVWTWGNNNKGQLGINNTDVKNLPVQVLGENGIGYLSNIAKVSAGSNFALALKDDNTVWAWGNNDSGKLGDNTEVEKWTPIQVKDSTGATFLTGINEIAASNVHSLALKSDGTVWSWGWNGNGQLGDGTNSDKATLPVQVVGVGGSGYLSDVSKITTGGSHSLVLKNDDTVWAWGSNGDGQLGDNTTSSHNTPVQVLDSAGTGYLSGVSVISGGQASSVAVKSDNSLVWNWGINSYGQLGNNRIAKEKIPVSVWGPASGTLNIGTTFYYSLGDFTSSVIDTGSFKTLETADFSITAPGGSTVQVNVRAGNSSNTSDPSWTTWDNDISTGADISSLGSKRYFQFSVDFTTPDVGLSPSLNDITFNYTYFPSGQLTSSPYNTSDAANVLSKVRWSQTPVSGTDINFQVRTASDSAGQPGTWTSWVGPDGTSGTYFVDKTGGEAMPSVVTDGSGDQWIQYKAFLISDGLDSPILSDVTMQYVVNAPPEVQNVIASQGPDGIVTVDYEVRDPDTNFENNVTPGKVVVGLQYCTANCDSSGFEVWANAATVGGDVGANISVEEVSWKAYQLTWNAKSDYPQIFNGSDFKVRVRANDSEGANNLGYGKSSSFVFDTKNPTNVSFFIDHTTSKLHIATPVDDSSYQMIVSNFADFHDASYQAFQGVYDYSGLTDDPATVYLRIKDAKGNYTGTTETTPLKLSDVVFYDISNPATSEYRELISWKAPGLGEMGSGGFAKYNIWRSTDGSIYNLVNSITDKNVNYYLDSNLVSEETYYYKVTLEDANGNISAFSLIVSDVPNGTGGANVTPAVISNVSVSAPSITSSSATITWDTDIQSDSTVGFSTNPGDFTSEIGNSTLVTSGHSVTVTGLDQNQTYYFRVKSIGVSNGVSIDDNFAVNGNHNGYVFTTATADVTPPDITNISSTPAATSAGISWSTDEASTSFVEYSTQLGFSTGSSYGSYDLALSHNITLPSILESDTTYYYKIHSKDGAGNEAVSGELNFHTDSLGDIIAPVISSVTVASKTHNTATITWTTDESATSYVEYGTTDQYGNTFGNGGLVAGPPYEHSISLPQDLISETTYHYRVHSADASNNESVSDDATFTTEADPHDIVAPILTTGPTVTTFSSTSATITWETDESSSSFVDYSPTLGNFQLEQGSSTMVQSHSVTLVNLSPNTPYYYQIKSVDASSNAMIENNGGDGYTFTTASGQPPVLQGSPLATKNAYNDFTISWTTDINSTSFVEFATLGDFSNSSVFGKYNSVKNHSINLQNLTPETTYYYRVRSASDFEMVSGSYSFDTTAGTDLVRPLISNASISNITDNGATITWDTSESTDSIVYLGETANFDKIFGDNSDAVLNHSVNIIGLVASTSYYYQIVSKDGAGNVTYGSVGSFTTISSAGAPVISNVQDQVASNVDDPATYNQVTISWDTDVAGDSMVSFSKDNSFENNIFHPADLLTSGHTLVINDLAFDTTYNYKVSTKGINGLLSVSSEKSFKTAEDPKYLHDPLKAIENVVTTPDSKSASITFSTDQLAKCVIEYREDGLAYPGGLSSESDFNSNHRMQLLSLSTTTKYYFRISCQDNIDSTPITSSEYSFTTDQSNGGSSDKILPVISGVKVGKATGESVVVSWNTDKKSSSYVRYGTKSSFGFMVGNDLVNIDQAEYVTSHTVTVSSLVPATKYYYSVVSIDASGNIAESSSGTFTTATQSGLGSISIISKTLGEAVVTWTTINNMTSTVEYGLSNTYGSKSESTSQTKAHEVDLKNLVIGSIYHFRVKSADSAGNIFVSGDYAFQPKSPPVITNVAVGEVTESGATVTFLTNVPAEAVAAYVSVSDPTDSGSQGQTNLVLSHSVVLKNLTPGMEYSLRVQAKDESGNASELAGPNFTVGKDTTPPVIDQIHTDSALTQNDKVQSIISWMTNEEATTAIAYKEGKNGDEREIKIGDAYTKNHLAVMTVFKPGVVYFFKVKSIDKTGNEGISNDFALLTPKKRENIIQIIINNFQEIFHWANM